VVKQEKAKLGEEKSNEDCWRDYFASPSDWWDNRQGKRNPKAPDFKHKVTRRALWIDGWYIPEWMKDRFLAVGRDSGI
jgi:hypothetical protein